MKYRIIKIKKSNNKSRSIYIPSPDYNQRLEYNLVILEEIFKSIEKKQDVSFAFQRGKNCVLNAKQHIGFQYTLSLDIEDFFDNIKHGLVSNRIPKDIIDECFINGAPRQGLLTSPIISEIAMIDIDDKLYKLSTSYQSEVIYTRYADDLIFSSNDVKVLNDISRKTQSLLFINGFKVNQRKTKYQSSRNGYRIITGISVGNDYVRSTRKSNRKLRAAIHQKNIASARGLYEWSLCKEPILSSNHDSLL